MKKLFLRTFGCQMNEYDSDRIADVLREAEGLELTPDPAQADVIVFNTCSVREKAQEKVFADLGRVKHLKRARHHEPVVRVADLRARRELARHAVDLDHHRLEMADLAELGLFRDGAQLGRRGAGQCPQDPQHQDFPHAAHCRTRLRPPRNPG